jgi:hypothetical protein
VVEQARVEGLYCHWFVRPLKDDRHESLVREVASDHLSGKCIRVDFGWLGLIDAKTDQNSLKAFLCESDRTQGGWLIPRTLPNPHLALFEGSSEFLEFCLGDAIGGYDE